MEEINISDLLKYYLKNIMISIVAVVIAFFTAITYNELIQTPLYKSSTTLVLVGTNSNTNETSQTIQTDVQVNEKLVTTYSEIIKSKRVLNQVISKLHLNAKLEDVASLITVSSVNNTSLIKISVAHENKYISKNITNTIAEVFKDEISEIYNLENVSIIDEAQIANSPYNVNKLKQILIFMLAGFVISCIIIFIKYYFDTSIKSQAEIESKLNVPVIGTIPQVHNKKQNKNKKKKGVR